MKSAKGGWNHFSMNMENWMLWKMNLEVIRRERKKFWSVSVTTA